MFSKSKLDKWLRVSVRRRRLDADLSMLRSCMKGNVLEIGAGRLGRRGDFSPPVSEAKRWVYIDIRHEVKPDIQANIEFLPCRPGNFDTVMCLEVLEYVSNPSAALSQIRQVLKVGGQLILGVPFLHRMDSSGDLWRFTEAGLRRLLWPEFRIQELYSQGSALGVVVNILKYAVSSQGSFTRRMVVGFFLRPLFSFLLWWDDRLAGRFQY